jgi:hypothetical protein
MLPGIIRMPILRLRASSIRYLKYILPLNGSSTLVLQLIYDWMKFYSKIFSLFEVK